MCLLCSHQARISLGRTEVNSKVWFVFPVCLYFSVAASYTAWALYHRTVLLKDLAPCSEVRGHMKVIQDFTYVEKTGPILLSTPCCFPSVLMWASSARWFVRRQIPRNKTHERLAFRSAIELIWLATWFCRARAGSPQGGGQGRTSSLDGATELSQLVLLVRLHLEHKSTLCIKTDVLISWCFSGAGNHSYFS